MKKTLVFAGGLAFTVVGQNAVLVMVDTLGTTAKDDTWQSDGREVRPL